MAAQAKGGRRSLGFILFLVTIIVGGSALIFVSRANRQDRPAAPRGVRTFENLSRDHVNGPVAYPVVPPAGGPHAATPLTCGYYSQPVPTANALHSLEHGAVWITYRASIGPGQVNALRRLAGTRVIVSPWERDDLPSPVVASAWGRQLRVRSADDPRLRQFIAAFRDGPQSPEPFAACSGVGTPE